MPRRLLVLVPLLAVLCLAVAPSAQAKAPTFYKAFWGPVSIDGKSQFPLYRRLGVRLFEIQLHWRDVAPARPAHATDPRDSAYRWPDDVAAAVKQAKRFKLKVLIMIIGAPAWSNGNRAWNYHPNPTSFAHFATAAARKYPSVHHWMIWGEPQRKENWLPSTIQTIGKPLSQGQQYGPRQYALVLDKAYGALKAASRNNLVIGGDTSVSGAIRPLSWLRAMKLPSGKPPRMDFYGHNPFCARTPNLKNPPQPGFVDFSDLGRLQKSVDKALARPRHKKHIRLFLSEWTVPTGRDREFNFHTTRAVQAKFIKAGLKLARKLHVYGLGWIHLRDEPPNKDGSLRSQGGLLDYKGKPKPGYYAFKRY